MVAKGYFLSEVQKVLRDELGLDVSIARLQRYDPRFPTGSRLSPDLLALYESTRTKSLEDLESLDFCYRAIRMQALTRTLDRAIEKGDDALATRVLAQMASEMDGLELIDLDPPDADANWDTPT